MATSTISLGKIKFNWRGDWSSSIAYKVDDVVKYGPNVYVCLTAHTSTSLFNDDFAKWDLMVAGLENAGQWDNSTLYKFGQLVQYGGAVYIALSENIGANPYTETSDWQKLVDGQQFEGEFNNASEYQRGDIVIYGGNLYIAKQNTQGNVPTNTTYFDLYVEGTKDQGNYSNVTTYKPGELVRFGGYLYRAKLDNSGNLPTNETYWEIYNKGIVYQGVYDDNTQYAPGEVVAYGGNRYQVKAGNVTTGNPPTNFTFWESLIEGISYKGNWQNDTRYNVNDVVKYGAKLYIALTNTIGNAPDIAVSEYRVFADGVRWQGAYSDSSAYIVGDIVRLSGRNYICIESYDNDGSTSPEPPNSQYWELYTDGLAWQGSWDISTEYEIGDVVEYAQSSYISIISDNIGITPGTDANSWNLVAQGDSNAVMTTQGDIIFRDATQATRLPIGPAGSTLVSNGTEPTWGHLTPQNDYYVSPQGDDTNDGRTPVTSWRTIAHAAEQTFNAGQVRINVSAGVYEEQTPIKIGRSVVLEGNGLGAVTISPNNDRDEGFGVGISNDGSTPNANSDVFHMNNGARMRNFVFRGFSNGAVCVSLDPGTGPDDTSVWITSQSPYVQNCTSFTPGGTGFKIDGALHNGGYKSMVANDWTQINSDGIGIHALNDARTEIVSCFTYYCQIGYLAESGAKIRAIVGNNSYGEFGAVARGFSQLETPLTGQLQLDDKTIDSITQISSNVHVFTSYRDEVGNRFFVGHTDPTGTDESSTFDNTASYPFVAKYNSAGSLDWIYTYESAFGAIHSAVELSDRIYCGGVIFDGSNKGFILSISKAGEIQWQKTIGNLNEIVDLATDGNNLYAVGNHLSLGAGVLSLNPAGVERWASTLSYTAGSDSLNPTSCAFAGTPTTSVDTYEIAGDATAESNLYISSYDTVANQAVITRLDSLGNYITSYNYGDVYINKLRLDTGNGDGIYLMAAGYYDPAGTATKNPLLFRLTVDGVVQWQSQFSTGDENGEWKDVLPFGNDVYVSGYLNESSNNNNTGIVARFTSTGTDVLSVHALTNSTNNLVLNGIMLDGVNVIAAGSEESNSVILNVQRDAFDLGTVSSGNYSIDSIGFATDQNTIISKSVNEIEAASTAFGDTDTTLTLNQSPSQTPTVVATRTGFAGIGTGVLFTIDNLERSPKEGSVLQIDGDDETYFVIGVNNYDPIAETGQVQIDPPIPSNKTPNDNTSVVFREAFSQVRMSGHDFLDIGTGGFADTNYPVIIASDYTQPPDQNRETLSENGGRVFYVTTDQDGNFRVGDYFKVEQATGRATLSSEEFDLAGLNELQLGSITAGRQGATVNEFSTDGTFADNSDTSVPTEKATKTYVDTQITNAIGDNNSIQTGSAPTETNVTVIGNGSGTDTIDLNIAGNLEARFTDSGLNLTSGVLNSLTINDTNLSYAPSGTEEFLINSSNITFKPSGVNVLDVDNNDLTYSISGNTTLNVDNTNLQYSQSGTVIFDIATSSIEFKPNGVSVFKADSTSLDYAISGNNVFTANNSTLQYSPGGSTSLEVGSQYVLVPAGTEANRPGSPSAGYLRFNTDTNTFEGYDGSQWSGIGGGNPWETISTNTTASNNDRYFIDTSGGAITVTLPASPSVGDQVKFADVAGTFDTNNLTIARNGEDIMNSATDMTVDERYAAFTLIYSGATYGWILGEN